MRFVLYIKNSEKLYIPLVHNKITIEWTRSLQAGVLRFTVVKDDVINYQEGNPVVLTMDDKPIFKGFVFNKKRNADQQIETTCYDQMRYFKNKDSMQFEDKTYSEYVKMICNDGFMKMGEIEDTKYKIPARTERDKEYFQMLQIAAEMTLSHTGKEYVLYDDAGKLCLKEWAHMPTTNTIITYDIAQNFDYETSINDTYNRIKVNYVDDLTGETKAYVQEDKKHIDKWGRLQYYAETSATQQIDERAKVMLELLNRKSRTLTINGALGDIKVRGGSLIPVYLPMLGDIDVNSLMLVDKVTHHIEDNAHFMDLVVLNKDIMPSYTGRGLFEGGKQRQKAQPPVQMAPYGYQGAATSKQVNALLNAAYSYLGWPYSQKHRGKGKYMDCSYFVWKCMKDAGFNVPRDEWDTAGMLPSGMFKEIPFSQVQPGDVGLWPKTSSHGGHTVIALSQTRIIHSTPPAVKESPVGKYANPPYKWYRPVNR